MGSCHCYQKKRYCQLSLLKEVGYWAAVTATKRRDTDRCHCYQMEGYGQLSVLP